MNKFSMEVIKDKIRSVSIIEVDVKLLHESWSVWVNISYYGKKKSYFIVHLGTRLLF